MSKSKMPTDPFTPRARPSTQKKKLTLSAKEYTKVGSFRISLSTYAVFMFCGRSLVPSRQSEEIETQERIYMENQTY